MRYARLAAVLALTTVTAAAPAARAETYEPHGTACGYSSVSDPSTDHGTDHAVVDGGPVAVTGGTGLPDVTLVCTLRAESDGNDHTGPALASVRSTGPRAAVVLPTVLSYDRPMDYSIPIVCSEVHVDSAAGRTTFYWDDVEARWSASPDVPCHDWTPQDPRLEPVDPLIDAVVCAALVVLFPPEGDVPGIWDCPPYED